MTEKYQGLLPPRSTWFHISQEEYEAGLLFNPCFLSDLLAVGTIYSREGSKDLEIEASHVQLLEQVITQAKLPIKTYY